MPSTPVSPRTPASTAVQPVRAARARSRQWDVIGKLGRLAPDSTGRAALFIGLFVALLWAPYLYLFGGRDAAQRWSVPGGQGLETLELRSLDARFAARGIAVPASADKIAIVGIDQNSLGIVGQWPWPRALHAKLIDKLKAAGARVIVIDVDFSDRQRPGKNGELSSDDRALIEAAGRAGNVVLPSLLSPELTGGRTYHLTTPFVADPGGHDGLDEQTLDLGLAYLPADADGRFRRYPFALQVNGETLGGLAPLSCAIYQGLLDANGSERYQKALQSGRWPTLNGDAARVPLGSTKFVGSNAPTLETLPLNFAGPGGTFATYPYAEVLGSRDAGKTALQAAARHACAAIPATANTIMLRTSAPR